MTYQEIEQKLLTEHITCPCSGKNDEGEDIIIERGYNGNCVPFYRVTTSQDNGWLRINFYYPDGTVTEEYER